MSVKSITGAMTEAECRAFAGRIKRFRKTYGLTQDMLAAAMGITKWTVLRLENSYYTPHAETMRRYIRVEEKYRQLEEMEFEGLEGLS